MVSAQSHQKLDHDHSTFQTSFNIGDPLFVRNFNASNHWSPGVIKEIRGRLLYTIQCTDGRFVCRHVDHVRTHTTPLTAPEDDFDIPIPTTSTADQPTEASSPKETNLEPCRSTPPRKPPSRHGMVSYQLSNSN